MRVLLFSDIHGNATALDAMLADSARHGPYDLTICAGDLVWAGPRPQEVTARMRELSKGDPTGKAGGAVCLHGNTDLLLLGGIGGEAPQGKDVERIARLRDWILGQLAPADVDFMRRMPFSHRVGLLPGHDLMVVHANPRNVDDPIHQQLTDAAIDGLVSSADFQVLAFGHVHVPFVRLWRGRLLVDVASAGLCMDGDTRAAYSVLTWDGGAWSVAQYRVEYDAERVARDMRRCGLPRGRHFAERMLAASYASVSRTAEK
jgi:predicted phosphodiesterase